MIKNTVFLNDVSQTAENMRRLALSYWQDLGQWLNVPLIQFYRFVCSLPYVPDPVNVETVSRPAFTLDYNYAPRDCDDKAVLLAAWCVPHDVKIRFVATSTKPNKQLHHVFTQLENGLFLDATYRKNSNFIGNYPFFNDVTHIEALTSFF